MLDPFLTEALERLDRRLESVCRAEERRAQALARGGASGWAAVADMAAPSAAELAFGGAGEDPSLVPSGKHALGRLASTLSLEPVEAEVLLVLLAPHLEARYRALYAVLQDDLAQPWVTERLLMSVLGRDPSRRRTLLATLGEGGRLAATGLVRSPAGESAPMARRFDLAPEVRDGLCGLAPPGVLSGVTFALHARSPSLTSANDAGPSAPLRVVHGAGSSIQAALALLRGQGGAPLLEARIPTDAAATSAGVRLAWRLAVLHGAVATVDARDHGEESALAVARELHGLVRAWGGAAVLIARNPVRLALPHDEVPAAGWSERVRAWREASRLRGEELSQDAAERLAAAHRTEGSDVARIVASAGSVTEEALHREARHQQHVTVRHGLRIEAERTFDDLVLRDTTREALERLVFYVRNRDRVREERDLQHRFGMRSGPVVLFAGRPGTGKTLSAEVVAGELGRPMHVVDLSQLVSKYIGETEKNIDQVLRDGERSGSVLFFDEADALFSNRTDVSSSNDRHANLEVGYLLQRIERHDGLVILATNLRNSIDDAFLRRFHTRVEFPFPEPEERLAIWELMLPPQIERAEALDLPRIAEAHRLAGGDIKNAALKAIFRAEEAGTPLSQAQLDRAIAVELLEMGRLSRRPEAAEKDRGELVKRFTESLQERIEAGLRKVFLKEIHIIHGAPTKEAVAGKRPGLNVALFRMTAPTAGPRLAMGFIVSAWSNRAEEENELLGVVLHQLRASPIKRLDGARVSMRVQDSYDFDQLHRFWSSHAQPVKASVVLDVEIS